MSYPELCEWIKPLCRYRNFEDVFVVDHKPDRLNLKFFTKDHRYSVSAKYPEGAKPPLTYVMDGSTGTEVTGDRGHLGYLGCIAQTRKPRAGEDWNRGNDLADGIYHRGTWNNILNDIIAYELVKVVKPKMGEEDK
uniref:Uncharacterized protein n=1 Tax=viral metagenome TaxID=1070528 RepID=A0A6M3Y4J0_9ZZZZ